MISGFPCKSYFLVAFGFAEIRRTAIICKNLAILLEESVSLFQAVHILAVRDPDIVHVQKISFSS